MTADEQIAWWRDVDELYAARQVANELRKKLESAEAELAALRPLAGGV
jgi:hypothetical protein